MNIIQQSDAGLKIPPNSDEAEAAVLGAMMLGAEAAAKAMAILVAESFYRPVYRMIYEAMTSLLERNEPIDHTTLVAALQRHGGRARDSAIQALGPLSRRGARVANIEHYARIVHERWLKRRLLAATSDIQTDCYEHASDIYELIDRAERRVFEIAEYSTRERGLFSMKRLAGETRQMLETARRDQARYSGMIGVPSGFRTLDNLTGGFQGSDLIVVAARPAMGKSSLALSIARNAAVESRVPVAFFTLEMSPQQMMLRLISAEAEVDALSLRTGRASDADWKRIGGAIERMQGVPLFIEDAPGLGIMELRARARMLKREHGVGLIIVDYLQLMHAPRAERREREISMISRSLKQLAKELHVPVIALSQLNRALEQRIEKRPMLSDLRESGAIEEDSDMVLFIHRPEYYGEKYYENGSSTSGVAEVIVAKHRNGPTGVAKLSFRKEFARFGPLKDAEEIEEYRRSVSNG